MSATLFREVFYSSVRFGLYTNIKQWLLKGKSLFYHALPMSSMSLVHVPNVQLNFFDKLVAGMVTGAIGSAIANPTDLVKIRMQHEYGKLCAESGKYLNGPKKGAIPAYRNTFHAFSVIAREEGLGLKGWMRGVYATVARASLITGGQLASYESAKSYFKTRDMLHEGPLLHTVCSVWSGLVAATFCAPADIVKTRMMCTDAKLVSGSSSAWRCFINIVKTEGVMGLYRGWLPSYLRLAPHFIISLPLNEQFRKLFGLSAL